MRLTIKRMTEIKRFITNPNELGFIAHETYLNKLIYSESKRIKECLKDCNDSEMYLKYLKAIRLLDTAKVSVYSSRCVELERKLNIACEVLK